MDGLWQPLIVVVISLGVGIAFARWLIHHERKSQIRAQREKGEVATKLHGTLHLYKIGKSYTPTDYQEVLKDVGEVWNDFWERSRYKQSTRTGR